jgi:predicted molibdopterin-dependent oxidoreductase YjgC
MSTASPLVQLHVHGRDMAVMQGTTGAAALALAGSAAARASVIGELRTPVCGMGICQECRVLINGRVRLACQTLCAPGMQVERMA